MKFFFAYLENAEEAFDPIKHSVHDEKIVDLQIKHYEGRLALAKVVVNGERNIENASQKHAIISFQMSKDSEIIPLFRGVTTNVAYKQNENSTEMWFFAYCKIDEEKDKKDHAKVPHYLQQIYQKLPFLEEYDRVSFAKETKEFVSDVVDFKFSDNPKILHMEHTIGGGIAKKLTLELYAEWSQLYEEHIDIYDDVRKAFPDEIIKTFSPGAIKKAWPKIGSFIGGNQYVVKNSSVKKIREIVQKADYNHISGKKNDHIKGVVTREAYMEGELSVCGFYQREMSEILKLELLQDVGEKFSDIAGEKYLSINLGNVGRKYQEWKMRHEYAAGAMVIHDDKSYSAAKNHRSSNSFDDDQEMWLPKKWQHDCQYKIGEVVEYFVGEDLQRYKCLKNHVSNGVDQLDDEGLWALIEEYDDFGMSENEVIPVHSSTFFINDNVGNLIGDVIDRAAQYVKRSSRIFLTKIVMLPDAVLCRVNENGEKKSIYAVEIMPHYSLEFTSLQNEKIKGKVVKYDVVINSGKRLVFITVASSVAVKFEKDDDKNNDNDNERKGAFQYAEDYFEESENFYVRGSDFLSQTKRGIKYDVRDSSLMFDDFLLDQSRCEVEVKNNVQEQKEYVKEYVKKCESGRGKGYNVLRTVRIGNSEFYEIELEKGTEIKIRLREINNNKRQKYIYVNNIKISGAMQI